MVWAQKRVTDSTQQALQPSHLAAFRHGEWMMGQGWRSSQSQGQTT
jgi:hypothetical protein